MMELMNKASQGEAASPKYETMDLPIDLIIPNPNNLYSMEGIDELADSILLAGRVLQNIVVKAEDENGEFMIISGHRRLAACQKLVEEGHDEFDTIPALVENEADENLRELMLIYTNSTSRILTDAEKMRQAQKATEILKNLKAEGRFEGRVRDAVARMLDTTGAQLARYAAIANNLTNPELKEAFEGGRLGVSAAYEASGLSDKGQEAIADKLAEGGAVSIQDVKEAKEQEEHNAGIKRCRSEEETTTEPEKDPAEGEAEEKVSEEDMENRAWLYAFETVMGELASLRDNYQGAAERHEAIAGDRQGVYNLKMTAEYIQRLIKKTESYLTERKKYV